MQNFISRLLSEREDLTIKLKKLREFILTDEFHSLSHTDKDDLIEQMGHMMGYLKVLDRRVSRLS